MEKRNCPTDFRPYGKIKPILWGKRTDLMEKNPLVKINNAKQSSHTFPVIPLWKLNIQNIARYVIRFPDFLSNAGKNGVGRYKKSIISSFIS